MVHFSLIFAFVLTACCIDRCSADLGKLTRAGSIDDIRVQAAAVLFIIRRVGLFAKHGTLSRVLRDYTQRAEEIINISEKRLRDWYLHYQKYGELPAETARWRQSRSRRSGRKKRSKKRAPRSDYWPPQYIEILRSIVKDHPEFFLDEIQEEFKRRTNGARKSASSIWKRLDQIGYSLQMVTYVAAERDAAERRSYLDCINRIVEDPKMLIFLDETAKDRNASRRRRTWAVRGTKAEMPQPLSRVDLRYSMLGACDIFGFVGNACEPVYQKMGKDDADPHRGTIDTDRFIDWVKYRLVPVLGMHRNREPRSIVVLDNAPIHHHPEVVRLIEEVAKAKIVYTAPYSPDLNPIEYYFKIYKDSLKRNQDIANRDPDRAHRIALCSVTAEHGANIFRKCKVPGCGSNNSEEDGIGKGEEADAMVHLLLTKMNRLN